MQIEASYFRSLEINKFKVYIYNTEKVLETLFSRQCNVVYRDGTYKEKLIFS